jgi:hypothetical protein
MLHRYRVLGAILALREFTIADLAHYTGVKETTVRTILNREARYVERAGTQARGRRGGQPIKYRMCADAEQDLVRILREVEAVGAAPGGAGSADADDPSTLSLVAAEDILLRQLPLSMPPDRGRLLDLAVADFETAQFTAAPGQREAATHLAVVDLLIRLAEVEQEALLLTTPTGDGGGSHRRGASTVAPSHEAEKKLTVLGRDLDKILSELPELSDKNLLPDLFRRIGSSPFAQVLLQAPDSGPDAALGTSPQVLLLDAPPGDNHGISAFVKKVLTQERVRFVPVPHSRWHGMARGLHSESTPPHNLIPLTAFCAAVDVGNDTWRTALKPFGATYGALRRTVVVADRYDEEISNHVNQLQGRFLCAQGLQPASLLGALSGALSEPSGFLTPAIANEATAAEA